MNLRLKTALWLERWRRQNLKQLHPLQQLFWESTLRCNVHCLHCGSDCIASVETPDMPAEDFLKVIDEEVTPHVNPREVMIIVSGGEPLMRKDLAQVGRALKERGYPWGMVTNGLALTEKRFRELREAGLRSITVSCDGLEEDHIWMRQHPLAFEGATRAIRLCAAEKGLVWDVVTCVNQRTIGHIEAIRDMLWGLGVRDWRVFGIDPMGRAAENPELLLTDEQFRFLMDFITAERKAGRHVSYSCEGFLGDYEVKEREVKALTQVVVRAFFAGRKAAKAMTTSGTNQIYIFRLLLDSMQTLLHSSPVAMDDDTDLNAAFAKVCRNNGNLQTMLQTMQQTMQETNVE